jgi:hypothetical protein
MSEEHHSADSSGSNEHRFLEAFLDPRVLDPLSEVTRRERKALLIVSLIALAITFGGLVPTEIQALGVKLSPPERDSILLLIALSVIYLLGGFSIYAWADWRSRSLAIALGRYRIPLDIDSKAASGQQRFNAIIEAKDYERLTSDPEIRRLFSISEDMRLVQRARVTGTWRAVFDLVVPILVGLAALGSSLYSARGLLSARIIGFVSAGLLALFILLGLWQVRKRITSFIKHQRNQWYKWRSDRISKRYRALEPTSARYAKLYKKDRKLFHKRLRLMGVTVPIDEGNQTNDTLLS